MAGKGSKGPNRYPIEKIRSLGAEILPLLNYKENHIDHANFIATNNPDIIKCLAAYPERFVDLELIAKSRLDQMYKGSFGFAKWVDFFDKYESLIEIASEVLSAFTGNPAVVGSDVYLSWWAQLIDLIPKTIFTGYYLANVHDAQGNHDWKGAGEFAWREILSLIPVVGPYFDLQNTYINRVTKVYQTDVANRFLASMGSQQGSQGTQSNPQKTSLEGIIDAEIVEPDQFVAPQESSQSTQLPASRTSHVPKTIDSPLQIFPQSRFHYPGRGDPRKNK